MSYAMFDRQWIIEDPFGRPWRLWVPRVAPDAGLPPWEARSVVGSLVHSSLAGRHGRGTAVIREILREVSCVRWDEDPREATRALEYAVQSRALRIARWVQPALAFHLDETPDTIREAASPPASEREVVPVDWIAVIVSDPDGLPLANMRCRVTTPGNGPRDAITDDQGRVMLRGIESGSCTIELPDVDGREWEAEAA